MFRLGGIALEHLEGLRERCGEIHSILDVSHSRGTLALMSLSRDAFDVPEVSFAEQVAEILSIGISRVEDLELN